MKMLEVKDPDYEGMDAKANFVIHDDWSVTVEIKDGKQTFTRGEFGSLICKLINIDCWIDTKEAGE